MVGLLGYLLLGVIVALVALRLRPTWYLEQRVEWRWRESDDWVCELPGLLCLVLTVVFWPLHLVGLSISLFGAAYLRSFNKKTRLRAELAAEMAAAQKEVESLLHDK